MGILDIYRCPNTECWWNETRNKKGEHCPECGNELQKFGFRDGAKVMGEKTKLLEDPDITQRKQTYNEEKKAFKQQEKEEKQEQERLDRLLFSDDKGDDDIINSIESDMNNLAAHEAGTKWMRIGTLLTFNSTEQMIGAGFKAIIDQNKVIIKQNELIYRQLQKLNSE